jgi:hypothetical protein
MRLMPLLRLSEPEQDLALLASPALGQLPVARGLCPLVGEVLAPPADLSGRARRGRGHLHIMATPDSVIRGEVLVKALLAFPGCLLKRLLGVCSVRAQ